MDCSRLIVHDQNTMLEPIRRAVESAIPTTVDQFDGAPPYRANPFQVKNPEDQRLETLLKESNNEMAKWNKEYPSQVTINSPENPLLGLREDEYYALKCV